uniref:small monomeric GTPase n=1 Tax=Arcella intermedia TaxID=1963864 RepID=A0A6B2LKI9_9EUKA
MVGSGGVGKSALLIQWVRSEFVSDYDPTIEDTYRKQVSIDGLTCLLHLVDTAGQEQYGAMREMYMREGEGFVLVYSLTSRLSFTEVEEFYQQVLRVKDSEEVPMVLVGNKADLERERQIGQQEGQEKADRWGVPFFESSALLRMNVEELFSSVVREIRKVNKSNWRLNDGAKKEIPKNERKWCTLL